MLREAKGAKLAYWATEQQAVFTYGDSKQYLFVIMPKINSLGAKASSFFWTNLALSTPACS